MGKNKVIAVGFVGYHEQSIDIVNQILNKKVFSNQHRHQLRKEFFSGLNFSSYSANFSTVNNFPIDSYHDTETETIYMHLDAHVDMNAVIGHVKKQQCSTQQQQQENQAKTNSDKLAKNVKSHLSFENGVDWELNEIEYTLLKSLLFMFHTCHMIHFIYPDKRFDMKHLRMLRILQLAKQCTNQSFLHHLSQSVYTMDLTYQSLYSPGRVLPTVAFVFVQQRSEWNVIRDQVSKLQQKKVLGEKTGEKTSENVMMMMMSEKSILEQMEKSLEAQMRSLLKKGRFIGSASVMGTRDRLPLFMVDPSKCAFVVVEPSGVTFGTKKSIGQFTNMLFNLSTFEQQQKKKEMVMNKQQQQKQKQQEEEDEQKKKKEDENGNRQKLKMEDSSNAGSGSGRQRGSKKQLTKSSSSSSLLLPLKEKGKSEESMVNIEEIREFLRKQYDYFRKQHVHKAKRLPSSFNWYHGSFAFEEFMCMRSSSGDTHNVLHIDVKLEKVKPFVSPDWQFSEHRCSQALNLVKSEFGTEEALAKVISRDNLSEHIDQAVQKYETYACDPYQEIGKQQLISELTELYQQQQQLKKQKKSPSAK